MKYKINTNDNINAINKDITNLEKHNKIPKTSNASYMINVKKNKKKTILLFSLYLLAFGSTTVTTVLLLNSNVTFNNSQFNPNANNTLWEDYYNKHHRNSTPISLDSSIEYFKNSNINFNVTTKPNDNGNIDFASVLSSIDNNLQNANIESNIDNDNSKLLPINFFLNVNYNPAVNFTVNDDHGKNLPITTDTFIVPKDFNGSTNYDLNVATNSQAPIFGIENANLNFQIKITIKNQIAIDISDLSFNFVDQTISITNPKSATINSIKDQWLIPKIEDQVAITLSKALDVEKAQIKPSYYNINFIDSAKSQDFTKTVNVQFSITTDNAAKNPWNFNGTKQCMIKVQNEIANLNDMSDLKTDIQNQYNIEADKDPNHDKNFQITLDNKKDINADNNLSDDDVTFVSGEIIKGVQDICDNYFKNNYSNLNISASDYTISTDLAKGADIFNKKLGKNIKITITANDKSSKLNGTLSNINAIVHGHNKNNITNSYDSPKGFVLDGIWLKDGKDKDILQEGQHFYEQNNLLDNWITNKENSLVNKVNTNSYHPVANSFSGSFTMNYQLDANKTGTATTGYVTVNISDINKKTTGGKVENFWDLITKTKSIFLETDVTTTSGWALNNVKLIFTNSEGQPTTDNTLYTLDLSSKFNGIAVTDRATLTFNDFEFNFKYEIES